MRTTYLVSASHPHPSYCFDQHPVRVTADRDGTFYADAAKLGCGRNYPSADEAIRGLFASHACQVTKIVTA
jgi:hypothetical protein